MKSRIFNRIVKKIDLNINESCNLDCLWCPCSDLNRSGYMSHEILETIFNCLNRLNFRGKVKLTARGEPLLHPNINHISDILHKQRTFRVGLITNGMKVNQYPDICTHFDFIKWNIYNDFSYRSYADLSPYLKDYGVKITVKDSRFGPDFKINKRCLDYSYITENRICHLPQMRITIDWNGDYLLCCNDWSKEVKFGNIVDIDPVFMYFGQDYQKYIQFLCNGDRSISPCCRCDYSEH